MEEKGHNTVMLVLRILRVKDTLQPLKMRQLLAKIKCSHIYPADLCPSLPPQDVKRHRTNAL